MDMKKVTYLSILCLCVYQITWAQATYRKKTLEEKARYYTKQMIDSLHVSEREETLVYAANLDVSKKFDSIYSLRLSNENERKAAFRAIYQYRDSCFKSILPIKEFLRFQDIEREKWERRKEKESKAD